MKEYKLPKVLQANINNLANAVTQNLQRVILIDGEQRSGKSNLAKAMAGKIAEKLKVPFDVNYIFFDIRTMIDRLSNSKGKVFVLDEAAFDLMGTDWQNKHQQKFVKMLYVAAKNSNTIILIIPELMSMSYKILKNCHCLFRVYMKKTPNNFYQRGFFEIYDKPMMLELFHIEKNRLNKRRPYSFIRDRCPDVTTNSIVVDEKIYEKNKQIAIDSLKDKEEDPLENKQAILWMKRFYKGMMYIKNIKNNKKVTFSDTITASGISGTAFKELSESFTEDGKFQIKRAEG